MTDTTNTDTTNDNMTTPDHLTEEQLASLKKRLVSDRKKLVKTIEVLEEQDPFKDPEHVLDNAAIDTDVREQLGHDTVEAEVKALSKKLTQVKEALDRIEKGTYGLDVKTKEPIPFERLDVMPETPYTVETEKKLFK